MKGIRMNGEYAAFEIEKNGIKIIVITHHGQVEYANRGSVIAILASVPGLNTTSQQVLSEEFSSSSYLLDKPIVVGSGVDYRVLTDTFKGKEVFGFKTEIIRKYNNTAIDAMLEE